MNRAHVSSLFVTFLLFTGCGRSPTPSPIEASPAPSAVAENPAPVPAPQEPKPQPVPPSLPPVPNHSDLGEPVWGAATARKAWTAAVRSVVERRLEDFENARDKELFCPGYGSARREERVNCWVLLISAISNFESDFNANVIFREPKGGLSVGLLALSRGECSNAPTVETLKDPIQNLLCGTNRMAETILADYYIDGPVEGKRGASEYWSTLRMPFVRWDPSRNRYLHLGYKPKILQLVRGYRGGKVL